MSIAAAELGEPERAVRRLAPRLPTPREAAELLSVVLPGAEWLLEAQVVSGPEAHPRGRELLEVLARRESEAAVGLAVRPEGLAIRPGGPVWLIAPLLLQGGRHDRRHGARERAAVFAQRRLG